ncbi:MAG: hypothetical protein JNL70_26335 [Saprospiraceae bacterium]|nr:hypothetical protein [Saprospiraceae bacterium]
MRYASNDVLRHTFIPLSISPFFNNNFSILKSTGTSWSDASGNLQAMIDASDNGDEVWVASGNYKPTSAIDRFAFFSMKASVKIYGSFAGTEPHCLNAMPH